MNKQINMKEEPNVMGIYYWMEDGVRQYRCRGIGAKYNNFYRNWIPNSSYKCIGSDFPWDFFIFKNPEDHDKLLQDYPEDVFEDPN